MENLLFIWKAVITGISTHKVEVGASFGAWVETLKVGAGAGAETNSFGSVTLAERGGSAWYFYVSIDL